MRCKCGMIRRFLEIEAPHHHALMQLAVILGGVDLHGIAAGRLDLGGRGAHFHQPSQRKRTGKVKRDADNAHAAQGIAEA